MKNLSLAIGSVFLIFLSSCKTTAPNIEDTTAKVSPYYNLENNGKLYASFYQQRAAEYEALCIQAYNIAKTRLDQALLEKSDKPYAIISDIDETLLDNSYYAVQQVKSGKTYTQKTWEEWTAKGIATPLTGSQEFYNYVAGKGVQVFYITNRMSEEREGTLKNLRKYNFPVQGEDHLILRTKEGSKENRRKEIEKNYNIILLLGDNLADFSSDFDKKTETERSAAVKSDAEEFGKKFIILPNFSYGDWESSFYQYKYDYPVNTRDSLMYNAVKSNP